MTISKSPTPQQIEILKFTRDPKAQNLVIEALAGTGKSTTMLEALKTIPQKSILLTAFNKRIADSLLSKLPKLQKGSVALVKTFHALGFAMIKNARPDLERVETAVEDLVNRVCVERAQVLTFQQKRWVGRLLGHLKGTTVDLRPEPEEILNLGYEFDVFGEKAREDLIEQAVAMTLTCYEASYDFNNLTAIDFDDMTWLPVVAKLEPVSRFQAIIVDELQDISEPQFELLRKVMLKTTRLIAVGDINQAIYGWRGGLGARAWAIMKDEFGAATLPLTVTFRCAKEIVDAARELVPDLQYVPGSDGGSVTTMAYADLPTAFVGGITDRGQIHTFVLSRRNDDLLDCALFLHRSGVRFQLNAGKELLSPLFYLLDYVLDLRNWDFFRKTLAGWREKELAKAKKQDSPLIADRCEQNHTMLTRAAREVKDPIRIKGLLYDLLKEGNSGVLLSTVHKVKGLEADRVYLLKQSFARHAILTPLQEALMFRPVIDQEEYNLEYVAITRARWHLIWVDNKLERTISANDASEAIAGISAGTVDLSIFTRDELDEKFCLAEREAQRLDKIEPVQARAWGDYANALLTEINSRPKEAR